MGNSMCEYRKAKTIQTRTVYKDYFTLSIAVKNVVIISNNFGFFHKYL